MTWRYNLGKCQPSPEQNPMTPTQDATALADELIAWVESYAKKVCPDGCLPTPGQEREISMFARITRALRAPPQTPDAEALAQFLCVDLALEPFDHISRPKYLADANSILRKFALSTPSASAGPQAEAVGLLDTIEAIISNNVYVDNDGVAGISAAAEDVLALYAHPRPTDGRGTVSSRAHQQNPEAQ